MATHIVHTTLISTLRLTLTMPATITFTLLPPIHKHTDT